MGNNEPRMMTNKNNTMARLTVSGYTISLDGYGAGPRQTKEQPLGVGGEELHEWLVNSRTFKRMHGGEGGEGGVDEEFAARSMAGLGAWIMGRNMFGPVRGPWPDESWRGWWGKNPPYHVPVFVLTHYARPPLEMEGGTVFHFVTDGIHAALERARDAAGQKDIRVGGGAATIRQYLEARLIDEMHVAVSPRLLGSGEPLMAGLDLLELGYRCTQSTPGAKAVHYVIART
jgi:dihydrofolate reductase